MLVCFYAVTLFLLENFAEFLNPTSAAGMEAAAEGLGYLSDACVLLARGGRTDSASFFQRGGGALVDESGVPVDPSVLCQLTAGGVATRGVCYATSGAGRGPTRWLVRVLMG